MFRSFPDWLYIEKLTLAEAIEHECLVKTEDSAAPLSKFERINEHLLDLYIFAHRYDVIRLRRAIVIRWQQLDKENDAPASASLLRAYQSPLSPSPSNISR